jgi:hypothetical protein
MNPSEFARLMQVQVVGAAVDAILALLKEPHGSKPNPDDLQLVRWFNGLNEADRTEVRRVIVETAKQTAFNVLTLLDGVTRIDDKDSDARLELTLIKCGVRTVVNDPTQELHRIFCAAHQLISTPLHFDLKTYEVDAFESLMDRARIGDGLDIHHVPDKTASMRAIKDYDPATAPAIVLSKGEHRKVTESPEE